MIEKTCLSVFLFGDMSFSCSTSALSCLLHQTVLVEYLALVVPSFCVHLKSLQRNVN